MAPFPSGALHIGNARMLYVNDLYRQRYHGRLLLVFDDTVGSKEKRIAPELFEVIRHDLEIADVRPDEVLYKSDRLPTVYEWAKRVIQAGGAYVCVCPTELLQERRARGEACPERAQSIPETLEGWGRMLDGGFAVGEAVLRLRTDLADPDPAFRDRVLCRLSDLDHPRVGRKWRVWPMLEFSWAVDDVELGITHVLRGKDLVMEDRMEQFVWNLLGIRGPPFLHWGLSRVAEAKISKSKGFAQVQSGRVRWLGGPATLVDRLAGPSRDLGRGSPKVHARLRDVARRHRGPRRDPLRREPTDPRPDHPASGVRRRSRGASRSRATPTSSPRSHLPTIPISRSSEPDRSPRARSSGSQGPT